jgi:hypothetical protein
MPRRLGKDLPSRRGGRGVVMVRQPFPGVRDWAGSKPQTIKRGRTLAHVYERL